MRPALRHVLLILLLATFVAGLSDRTVVANSMAVEMSQMDADMTAMGCEPGTPDEPCDLGSAHCAIGCIAPGAVVPAAATVPTSFDATQLLEASTPDLRSGTDFAPRPPPPRTTYIA